MPERYPYQKGKGLRLSEAHEHNKLILVCCDLCHGKRYYFPDDLRRLLGNLEIDDISLKCETCGNRDYVRVTSVHLTGQERDGIRVRKLVAIKVKHVPVWQERPL